MMLLIKILSTNIWFAKQLAKTASEASNATQIPDWMAQQYRDQRNAQLGTNVNSLLG